jgi:Nucleotidyl transferase AbiEii toxin, Type IV TA system
LVEWQNKQHLQKRINKYYTWSQKPISESRLFFTANRPNRRTLLRAKTNVLCRCRRNQARIQTDEHPDPPTAAMITLEAIKKYYPAHLHGFERELLREYLQCQILPILFDSPMGKHFAFLGGTCCLRLVHENKRFSEDLDFNNFAVSAAQFDQVAEIVEKELKGNGYVVEIQIAGTTIARSQ